MLISPIIPIMPCCTQLVYARITVLFVCFDSVKICLTSNRNALTSSEEETKAVRKFDLFQGTLISIYWTISLGPIKDLSHHQNRYLRFREPRNVSFQLVLLSLRPTSCQNLQKPALAANLQSLPVFERFHLP